MISVVRTSISSPSWQRGFLLLAVVLVCLVSSSRAQENCREGCDSDHYNTYMGELALYNNTTGQSDTATGRVALYSNTTGSYNTATGDGALHNNTAHRFLQHDQRCEFTL